MRVDVHKILLLAFLAFVWPAALTASPAVSKAKPKAAPSHVHAVEKPKDKPQGRSPVRSQTVAKKVTRETASIKGKSGKKAPAPVVARLEGRPKLVAASARHAAARTEPEPKRTTPRPEPVIEAAPVHDDAVDTVRHNRKEHLAAPPVEEIPEAPRKATPADFMAAAGEALPLTAAPAPPAIAVKKIKLPKPVETKNAEAVTLLKPEPAVVIPPVVMAALYTRRGKLIVPPALKGSHEILLHQNEMADRDGLDRIQDDDDLERMRADKLLVAIPSMPGIAVDERLPANRRYTRPWTAQFLMALARAHYARFHSPLQVNSAVRTVQFQQRLLLTNGNAAPAGGETASPHLTGQAVDLAKHGLSMTEIAWLRGYLLPLVQQGKVDVEEEFQQACFHISVYRKYVPAASPRREIAEKRKTAASALAVAIH